jgi:hypothetical protein
MLIPAMLTTCTVKVGTGSSSTDTTTTPTTATTPETSSTTTTTSPTPTGDTGTTHTTPASNRDRLLLSYLGYLQSDPTHTQTNDLRGSDLHDVCDLWDGLDKTSQATFLTVTDRLEGSILAVDGSNMLDHVTALYRAVGGENASGSDPGSCGGGEFNRLMMSMDQELHASLLLAFQNQGSGPDIADIPTNGFWRDSHDLGGTHAPFTLSDETDDGAPRGQVQFFEDPTSAVANQPLGRVDLEGLVDPYALEMDQDYDCVHNSNPGCEYTFYGPFCVPETTQLGTAIYTDNYGSFDPAWRPDGC